MGVLYVLTASNISVNTGTGFCRKAESEVLRNLYEYSRVRGDSRSLGQIGQLIISLELLMERMYVTLTRRHVDEVEYQAAKISRLPMQIRDHDRHLLAQETVRQTWIKHMRIPDDGQ